MGKKRLLATVGAIALTAALTVAGTLAYLSFVTDSKENKFSSNGKITGELTETEWKYDENGWTDYTPGKSTFKNPAVVISDKSVEAYIAMKVECVDANGKTISLNDFMKDYASVSHKETNDGVESMVAGINKNFTKYGDTDLYVFNKSVVPGTSSETLFDQVTINMGIVKVYGEESSQETIYVYETDENGNKVGKPISTTTGPTIVKSTQKVYILDKDGKEVEVTNDTTLPSFDIKVTGYAVQKDGLETTYTTELAKLAGLYTAE